MENINKKTILITGGAGFIGSQLAKKLTEGGYGIVIADRLKEGNSLKKTRLEKFLNPEKYKFYNLELNNSADLKKIFTENQFDVICHLAAKTNLEPDSEVYNKMNILGTIGVFEMAKEFKVPKVVFASSSMVYGDNIKLPFSESHATDHPLSIYAATRKFDEVLAYTYHYLCKIKMVGLRFFTTYGPWGRPETSISRFTDMIAKGETIEIHNFGKIKRDFSYVDDIVCGITAALEKDLSYELINLGSGQSVELAKIINLIEKNLGLKAKKKFVKMQPGDLEATWADITKAKELLGYHPATTIKQGIKKFVDWYREYHQFK